MAFYGLSKLPFASPQRLQPPQQAPLLPNRHPRAKATSPTGTPGPGHSNGFLWPFKAAVCQPANAPKLSKRSKPSKTCYTLQTPSPAGPPDPDFLEAFKAAVCQPAKAATPPSPTGTPGPRPLPEQAPQGQGHFPNRHPKARPQQWLSMGFQSCRLPARKGCNPPNRHPCCPTGTPGPRPLPQQAPQGQATAMAFYGLSKLPFASPQTLQNSPNAPNPPKPATPSKHRPQQAPLSKLPFASPQKLQPHLPQQAPQGQATAMAFYGSCRLPARKPSKTLKMLQTLQNPLNPPKPAKPSKPSKLLPDHPHIADFA